MSSREKPQQHSENSGHKKIEYNPNQPINKADTE